MGVLRRVTDAQVKELRGWVHRGASLKKAAMKAAMDRKTARKYRDLDRLPSDYRQVLVLHHLEECDFPEVARRLGRSVEAVKKLWARALARLRRSAGGAP